MLAVQRLTVWVRLVSEPVVWAGKQSSNRSCRRVCITLKIHLTNIYGASSLYLTLFWMLSLQQKTKKVKFSPPLYPVF